MYDNSVRVRFFFGGSNEGFKRAHTLYSDRMTLKAIVRVLPGMAHYIIFCGH